MNPSMVEPMPDDEINLREFWRILIKRRKFILIIVGAVAVATGIFTLLQPNVYESKATLIPLAQSNSNLQSTLGALSGLLPLGVGAPDSPAERILAVLQSRTLAENVITRLALLPKLFAKDWDAEAQRWQTDEPPTMQDGLLELQALTDIAADDDTGIVSITVEHTDPELAAQIANRFIEALQEALNQNAFSMAKKNRFFIDGQLRKTQKALAAAEDVLQHFEETHGIVAMDAQAEAAINALATLQGQMMAKEIQLRVLQRSVTGASREVTLLQEELQGLRAQLAQLQRGATTGVTDAVGDRQVLLGLHDAPEIKLNYVRLQREVRIQNELFMLLMQQLEQAKIEEVRDETAFQVVDQAIAAEEKSKPKRALNVLLATVVGTFLGVFAAFSREYLDATIRTREQVERQLGMRVLATVPSTPSHALRHAAEVVDTMPILTSGAPDVEALRYLHARLRHCQDKHEAQAVLLTTVGPDEATRTLLVNLARVAANAGERTLLIDSNLRQPALHHLLACEPVPGLAELLEDPQAWNKSVRTTRVNNLHLIPAGEVTAASLARLESTALDVLLSCAKERYDLILCTAPPALDVSDAVVLSRKVDATCLLLTLGASRLEDVSAAMETLEAVQARVLGAILAV